MFGTRLSRLGSVSRLGLVPKAIGILRSYGADAHVYLPGIGTVSGLTAGNYLDSAGTTAATVDNPVGLSLDALQAMTLGSELAGLSSAWLTYGTGISLSGGQMIFSSTPAAQYTLKSVSAISAQKTYKLTLTIDSISGGDLIFVVSGGAGITPKSAPGTYTAMAVSDGTDGPYMYALNGTVNAVVSVASCVEIPGIHATQATTANKPILRRGLLNQLLWSSDLTNAAWVKNGVTPTSGQADSFGGSTACRLQASGGVYQFVYETVNWTAGIPATLALKVKSFSGSNQAFRLAYGSTGSNFSSILTATNSWQILLINFTSVAADILAVVSDAVGAGASPFDIVVERIGLFQGTYTAQQIIDAGGIPLTTTAAASNTSAGKYSWQFDGSNDYLALSAPLFQMSDDHCVIAGVNQTIAANSYVFSQNNTAATTLVGAIAVTSGGFARALWGDDIGTTAFITGSVPITGVTKVVTAIKRTNAKQLRVNGSQDGATNNTVMGATTLNTASIGSYTTAGNLTGSIYPIIAIKGTLSDSDLLVLERFVGQLSGVSI